MYRRINKIKFNAFWPASIVFFFFSSKEKGHSVIDSNSATTLSWAYYDSHGMRREDNRAHADLARHTLKDPQYINPPFWITTSDTRKNMIGEITLATCIRTKWLFLNSARLIEAIIYNVVETSVGAEICGRSY